MPIKDINEQSKLKTPTPVYQKILVVFLAILVLSSLAYLAVKSNNARLTLVDQKITNKTPEELDNDYRIEFKKIMTDFVSLSAEDAQILSKTEQAQSKLLELKTSTNMMNFHMTVVVKLGAIEKAAKEGDVQAISEKLSSLKQDLMQLK